MEIASYLLKYNIFEHKPSGSKHILNLFTKKTIFCDEKGQNL